MSAGDTGDAVGERFVRLVQQRDFMIRARLNASDRGAHGRGPSHVALYAGPVPLTYS